MKRRTLSFWTKLFVGLAILTPFIIVCFLKPFHSLETKASMHTPQSLKFLEKSLHPGSQPSSRFPPRPPLPPRPHWSRVDPDHLYYGNPHISLRKSTEMMKQKITNNIPDLDQVVTLTPELREFLSKPPINRHNYRYIYNPRDTCKRRKVDILFVVPSEPINSFRRRKVRKSSLYSYTSDEANNAALLFFTGVPSPDSRNGGNIRENIDGESDEHGDIVQQDFVDVYRHLRLKAVSMLQWAATFCFTAKYVIRTDDDVEVNVTDIVSAINRIGEQHADFVLGQIVENRLVARSNQSKYFVSHEEYPEVTWPPFALGGLLGYPVTTVRLLYEAALRVPPVWLDDVYITSFCREHVNVTLLSDPAFTFTELNPLDFNKQ